MLILFLMMAVVMLLRLLGALLILYGGMIIAVPFVLPYAVAWSPNRGARIDFAGDSSAAADLHAAGADRHLRVEVEGRASLFCLVLEPGRRARPRATVLVLHGHRADKAEMLELGRGLAAEGYRAVLVDHRGHGRSTGDYLSYGIVESRDMMTLLDSLQQQGLVAGSVGVLGFSYGGSVGMQLAARDSRVKTLVTVSTFSSLRRVVGDYIECFLPFASPFISDARIDAAVQKAGAVGGYDPAEADTERAARRVRVPVLLFHGRDDRRIPFRHGLRLAHAVKTEHRFVPLPGCGHGDVMTGESGGRILRESLEWFGEHLR